MSLRRTLALALAALLAGACASVRAPPAPVLELPPEPVEVRRGDLDLLDRNDEELFALGLAASQAGDPRRAAAAFERLADHFPVSRHRAGGISIVAPLPATVSVSEPSSTMTNASNGDVCSVRS